MDYGLTKKELANIAGYTYRRLYDIDRDLPQDKKLFVRQENGEKYDLPMFVQRWVEYNLSVGLPDVEDLEVVKARHEVVKTQKTELEVQRMRGQLIDLQDVKKLWADVANTVTQNLIHLPSKVAPVIRAMEDIEMISSIIDAEIRSALEAIAETPLPVYAAEEEDGADAPSEE